MVEGEWGQRPGFMCMGGWSVGRGFMAEGSFTIRSKVFSTIRPEAEIEKLSLLMITFPKVPRS